jgi:hypothetical protein
MPERAPDLKARAFFAMIVIRRYDCHGYGLRHRHVTIKGSQFTRRAGCAFRRGADRPWLSVRSCYDANLR